MDAAFLQDRYLIRRKFWSFLGAKFQVFDPAGNLVFYSHQKAFKLKEDIRVYADEAMTQERLVIKARQIIDFSAAYDVVDAVENVKVGALRRKGLASIIQDSWEFLDNQDRPIAQMTEDSTALALVRRFLVNLIPQKFHVTAGGRDIVHYRQNFNPFLLKLNVELAADAGKILDPRLILAGGILLAAIEGRQQ